MKNEENKHIIAFRKSDLILPIIVTIFFIVITFFIYRDDKFAGLVGALALLSTALTLYSIYATLFIKVYIGENSFTHQKAPGVSKTYNYSDITELGLAQVNPQAEQTAVILITKRKTAGCTNL